VKILEIFWSGDFDGVLMRKEGLSKCMMAALGMIEGDHTRDVHHGNAMNLGEYECQTNDFDTGDFLILQLPR